MIWTLNGIVVALAAPGSFTKPEDNYRGISYGEPWPLQSMKTAPGSAEAEMIQVVKRMPLDRFVKRSDGLSNAPVVDDLSFHPSAMSDTNLALRYIELCNKQNIPVRKLLCATTCSYPTMDELTSDRLISQSRFLGYDYISYDFSYSAVQAELMRRSDVPDSWIVEYGLVDAVANANRCFENCSRVLNEFGLFENESDLQAYLSARCAIVDQTTVQAEDEDYYSYLETSIELWPCMTWEIL